jgi:hypothetical protein
MISSSGDQSGAGAKISDLLAPENKNSQFVRNRSFVVTWKRGKANKVDQPWIRIDLPVSISSFSQGMHFTFMRLVDKIMY